jgi:hypothetical protein
MIIMTMLLTMCTLIHCVKKEATCGVHLKFCNEIVNRSY